MDTKSVDNTKCEGREYEQFPEDSTIFESVKEAVSFHSVAARHGPDGEET